MKKKKIVVARRRAPQNIPRKPNKSNPGLNSQTRNFLGKHYRAKFGVR